MAGTQADALTEAQRLAACLRAHGVTVSIELQPGVASSGWLTRGKVGVLAHHTVSRRSQGNTPCLALVKHGRPDVPGPLCNGYGGFDEVYRIITMGWANHSGAGGPLTLAGFTIPKDNGRPYLWGTEFEGGLDPADFTPSYRAFMARAHLGVLDYLGRPIEAHGEHLTWAPGRKIDRLGYTTERGRNELRAVAAGEGDDMTAPTQWTQADWLTFMGKLRENIGDIAAADPGSWWSKGIDQLVARSIFANLGPGPNMEAPTQPWGPGALVASAAKGAAQALAEAAPGAAVDVDALAAQLVPALTAALGPALAQAVGELGVVTLADASVEQVAETTADRFSTRLAQ